MSVVKWVIGGTTFDLNPSEDTGWVVDVVVAEQHPPGAAYDILQLGGTKSAVRVAKGVTKSLTVKNAIAALVGTTAVFSDHYSASNTVYVKEFKTEMVNDISNLPPAGTFKYQLTLVKR